MRATKLRLFHFRGVPFEVSLLSLFVAGFVGETYSSTPVVSALVGLGFLVSIALHELAHALVGSRLGAKVSHVELNFLGGATYFSRKPPGYYRDIATSLAGPLTNLVLWQMFEFAAQVSRPFGVYSSLGFTTQLMQADHLLAGLNLALGIFNLLPCYPLDGGQALYSLFYKYSRPKIAAGLVGGLSLLLVYTVFFTSIPTRWLGYNLNLLANGFNIPLSILTVGVFGFMLFNSFSLYRQPVSPIEPDEVPDPAAKADVLALPLTQVRPSFGAFEQGRTALLTQDWQRAVQDFSQALALEPDELHYLSYRAYAQGQAGNWAEAITDYDRLLERYPQRADFWLGRAEARYTLGDYASARRDVGQSLHFKPHQPQATQLQTALEEKL